MVKVTFVLGLAGSGKTHYSERYSEQTGARIFEGIVGADTIPDLLECLRKGQDAVVEEISYCKAVYRAEIEKLLATVPDLRIQWVCFENDKASANWNVRRRTNKGDVLGHLQINERTAPAYTYPPGATILPITRVARTK